MMTRRSTFPPFSKLLPTRGRLFLSIVLIGWSGASCFGQTTGVLVPTQIYGEAVYQGLGGMLDFSVPDAKQPTRGGLSATVTFSFLIQPKPGLTLKVLPEKSKLLTVQSDDGDEWRMQPEMMKSPQFLTLNPAENDRRVFLKLPLRVGKESNLTVVSGQIAVAVRGSNKKATTGVLEPAQDMRLKLGNDAAVVEGVSVYQDGREVIVMKADSKDSAWCQARYRPTDRTSAEVAGQLGTQNRVIFTFPGKAPKGEFVAETGEAMGEAGIPFTAVLPNRNLFGSLAGQPMVPIPNVKGDLLKPGQSSAPVAKAQSVAKLADEAEPLSAAWQKGEVLRFSAESINDTRMPGDLGGHLHVRLRNDIKIEVLEILANGNARLGLTFERVRMEETDEEGYRMTDTSDDTPEKREKNPWSRIIGHRVELIQSADSGEVTVVKGKALAERLAGGNLTLAISLERLLRASDLEGLIEQVKPDFPNRSRHGTGRSWKDAMNPRIPLSDLRLIGEERVTDETDSRLTLSARYSLPADVPPEKRLGQQLEFKMVGASYRTIEINRRRELDLKLQTCTHQSMEALLVLDGKLGGKPLEIESTMKSHCWLLEHSIK